MKRNTFPRKKTVGKQWLFLLVLVLCSCSASEPIDVDSKESNIATSALIHGNDDRADVYAVEDGELRSLATQSTVALFDRLAIKNIGDNSLVIKPESLEDIIPLCESERFGSQPSLSRCSGVFIGEDLILTAAHCMRVVPCQRQLWVFGYAILAAGDQPKPAVGNVYRCRAVLLSNYSSDGERRRFDHAIVQLDRPVSLAKHAAVLAETEISVGERVTVIGHPAGLPTKIDSGAIVLDTRESKRDYLSITSDTFFGSSGSGVFNKHNELVAIVVRGGTDFEYQKERDCFVARHVDPLETSNAQSAEHASYARTAIAALCDSGWSSELLCNGFSSCGDGQCSIDEHTGPCASDCPFMPIFEFESSPVFGGCIVASGDSASRVPIPIVELVVLVLLIQWFPRNSRKIRKSTLSTD